MDGEAGPVVRRLRARQGEIEDAIFARVREAPAGPAGQDDALYVEGQRGAIAAAVEYWFAGVERGERTTEIPAEAVAQARRAASTGVSLETVLRRYIAGHALLWDYVIEEAERVRLDAQGAAGLRAVLHAQASLLDRIVTRVTREHVDESVRASRSREQRRVALVRSLLAGEHGDRGEPELAQELDYELDAEHVGLIARGASAPNAVRWLASRLDRRPLCVACGEGAVWAWLGGPRGLRMEELERVAASAGREISFALGEPASGLAGWRLTHRQAQAALAVALRRPRALTRYADVALLASALADRALAGALIDAYLAPLNDVRGGGAVLRRTLRAYLAAERSVSSTAAALGVARKTVEGRLRTIEARLGRSLHPCPAELEVALLLDELGEPSQPPNARPALGTETARRAARE